LENSWRYLQVKVHHRTGINDIGGKFYENYLSQRQRKKNLTLIINFFFPTSTTGVADTGGK
jgi:hypothetical protein